MGGGSNGFIPKLAATTLTGGISDVLGYGAVNDAANPSKKTVGTPLDPLLAQAAQTELDNTLNDALTDQNVDDTTKLEIQNFAKQQEGISSPRDIVSSIKATVKTAEAGKGIYGIRMKNQQERSILADMPGRMQTVAGGL